MISRQIRLQSPPFTFAWHNMSSMETGYVVCLFWSFLFKLAIIGFHCIQSQYKCVYVD